MTDEELMKLSEEELKELIEKTKKKIEKLKLENLKKRIMLNETITNNQ